MDKSFLLNYNTEMEQLVYIFTIILEIIVAYQIGAKIVQWDKKVVALNISVIEIEDKIPETVKKIKDYTKKLNKVLNIFIKIKQSKVRKIIMFSLNALEVFLMIKSLKSTKGFKKLKFLKKFFSYSLIRSAFSVLKCAIS